MVYGRSFIIPPEALECADLSALLSSADSVLVLQVELHRGTAGCRTSRRHNPLILIEYRGFRREYFRVNFNLLMSIF